MKRLTTACLLLLAPPVIAGPLGTFNDPCTGDSQCSPYTSAGTPLYHGGNGTNPGPVNDVIGSESIFDILSLTASRTDTDLIVNIVTRFVPDSYTYPNSDYGDLLLSTLGWHPYGAAPYDQDTAGNSGTTWDFVIATDGGQVYQNAALANSDDLSQDGDYRHDQYVKYASGGTHAGNAVVTLDPVLLPNIFDGTLDALGTELIYNIPLALLGLPSGAPSDIAFRWTTTGANDIIEAAVTLAPDTSNVPEPASLALWSAGLAAWRLRRPAHWCSA